MKTYDKVLKKSTCVPMLLYEKGIIVLILRIPNDNSKNVYPFDFGAPNLLKRDSRF